MNFALVTMAPTSGVSSHLITQSGHVETEPSHTKHYGTYSTDITDIPVYRSGYQNTCSAKMIRLDKNHTAL